MPPLAFVANLLCFYDEIIREKPAGMMYVNGIKKSLVKEIHKAF